MLCMLFFIFSIKTFYSPMAIGSFIFLLIIILMVRLSLIKIIFFKYSGSYLESLFF